MRKVGDKLVIRVAPTGGLLTLLATLEPIEESFGPIGSLEAETVDL